jgi:hypothetical protein
MCGAHEGKSVLPSRVPVTPRRSAVNTPACFHRKANQGKELPKP